MSNQLRGFIWIILGIANAFPFFIQDHFSVTTLIYAVIPIFLIYKGLILMHLPLQNIHSKMIILEEKNRTL